MKHSKYLIQIERISKYDYTSVVADRTTEKPEVTTIMAKSMEELMARVLVALVLRDKNAGVDEGKDEAAPTEEKPMIFTPTKKIVTP